MNTVTFVLVLNVNSASTHDRCAYVVSASTHRVNAYVVSASTHPVIAKTELLHGNKKKNKCLL